MKDEWRVRLAGCYDQSRGKPVSARTVSGLLRAQPGADVPANAGKTRIFFYAASAEAATTSAGAARDLLAQQGLAADFALERLGSVAAGLAVRERRGRR